MNCPKHGRYDARLQFVPVIPFMACGDRVTAHLKDTRHGQEPGLLAVTREKMRTRHLALRSEQTYLQWIRRYVVFHKRRHPRELGATEVEQFLTHLAVDRKVSAATQNQALQALLFLYRHVLEIDLPWLTNVTRAVAPKRLPVVLTRAEVSALLSQLEGTSWLVASLLYGSGLRLMEGLRLRVKDLALERGELMVREAKGGKDRITMVPAALQTPLRAHLSKLRSWFEEERRRQRPGVSLPHALARKFPQAATQWGWQYLFPSAEICRDPYRARRCATTCTRRQCSGRCRARCARPASRSRRAVIRCVTASPPTCWRTVTTSAPPGAARPRRPQDDDDLHPRHVQGRERRSQPARSGRRAAARASAAAGRVIPETAS